MSLKLISVYRNMLSNQCDLLAEIDDKGRVVKVFDYDGTELKIIHGNKVIKNGKEWDIRHPIAK
ncbi:hypothetical protein MMP64_08255 [Acinetobacter sp. ANC 5659]|uniref:hypothetical protein n=1 Tax=Acinetobacter higginsii TaxID=70347 RepID=UPI001F4AF200|nr:hypothetical protein [Acinetobacter higginsii]MCH7317930.1 hypothetical protein [Acinetobacter higginsii]